MKLVIKADLAALIAMMLVCVMACIGTPVHANVTVTAIWQVPNEVYPLNAPEGNEAIRQAKASMTDAGGYVYMHLANSGAEAVRVNQVTWTNDALDEEARRYQKVWQRVTPVAIPAGGESELAICLRSHLLSTRRFEIELSNGQRVVAQIRRPVPRVRVATVAFSRGLESCYVYLTRTHRSASLPEKAYVNGQDVSSQVTWLGSAWAGDTAMGILTLPGGFQKGRFYTIRFQDGQDRLIAATGIRAYDRLSVFGTYGGSDFERFAENGLDAYNSFGRFDRARLDRAQRSGVRVVPLVKGKPAPDEIGHPAVYAFGQVDEPDVKDYGVKNVPMRYRIGHHAPLMLEYVAGCHQADEATPTTLTLNLTFTPFNYFIYGPIADLANPDCYPITSGWPVDRVRNHLINIRRATMPRPYTFTYQASWEEYGVNPGKAVSRKELVEGGFDKYRDPKRTRGLGRKPAPQEVQLQMLYAIGLGAKGLYAWTDRTEMSGNLMFHGSDILPEMWEIVGLMSRRLRLAAPLIEIGHDLEWARSERSSLWIRTLLTGRDAALVVVVNDDFTSEAAGFKQTPQQGMTLVFPNLPWMKGQKVYRVEDGRLVEVSASRGKAGLSWQDDIACGEIYLVCESASAAETLLEQYEKATP